MNILTQFPYSLKWYNLEALILHLRANFFFNQSVIILHKHFEEEGAGESDFQCLYDLLEPFLAEHEIERYVLFPSF